jgi:hypothetical protein
MEGKMDSKTCKHVYHHGGMARGISLTAPEFQDDVCVFLYCPKCLEQMTLIYRINKERSHADQDEAIIEHIQKQQSKEHAALELQKQAEELQARLIKNLSKLNYAPDRIKTILTSLTIGDTLVDDLTALLPEEHKLMAKMIATGELVN